MHDCSLVQLQLLLWNENVWKAGNWDSLFCHLITTFDIEVPFLQLRTYKTDFSEVDVWSGKLKDS